MLETIREEISQEQASTKPFSELYLEYVCSIQDSLIHSDIETNRLKLEQETASSDIIRAVNTISDTLSSLLGG